MKDRTNEKIYPQVGNLYEQSKIQTFEKASPWIKANTSFYWINFEYPVYHGHTDWEIQIVLNDHILHKINGETKIMTEGSACLVGPKDEHSFHYPNGVKNQFQAVCLSTKDSYMKALLGMYSPTLYEELCNAPHPLSFTLSHSTLEKLTNILLEIQTFHGQSTPYTEQQCNLIFSNILLNFIEQYQNPSGIPEILKPLIQHLNNPLITNEQIKAAQQELPYSYPQLTRIFKKHMGCTITQYVNRTKLQHAKELLTATDMSITEITNELCFESTSYFHNLFKKHFDMTPAKYRKLDKGFPTDKIN